MNENMTEWVGYFATIVLMIAFLMKDVRKLRYINTIGCFAFIVYGFLLNISWPIVISNAFIATVNIYYLFFKKD